MTIKNINCFYKYLFIWILIYIIYSMFCLSNKLAEHTNMLKGLTQDQEQISSNIKEINETLKQWEVAE